MRHSLRVRHVVLSGVAVIVVLAVGVVAGMAATWDEPPALLVPPPSGGMVAVTGRQFDDSQMVGVQFQVGPPRTLQAPGTGKVTAFSCAVGARLESGTTTVSVDGVPAMNLATPHPLWRDLHARDSGVDVTELADALVTLGYLGETTSTVSSRLLDAWVEAQRAIGDVTSETWIPLDRIEWLPADGIAIASCRVAVGDLVASGQSLADLTPTVVGASLVSPPMTSGIGEHILTVEGERFTLTADGQIANPTDLDRLARLPSVAFAVGTSGSGQVSGTYALVEPLMVSVVPPASVVVGPDGSGCVVGDGGPQRVQVVGSQLGQSLVIFTGTPPAKVATDPPRDLTCG